jgi:hypothetical protein
MHCGHEFEACINRVDKPEVKHTFDVVCPNCHKSTSFAAMDPTEVEECEPDLPPAKLMIT